MSEIAAIPKEDKEELALVCLQFPAFWLDALKDKGYLTPRFTQGSGPIKISNALTNIIRERLFAQ